METTLRKRFRLFVFLAVSCALVLGNGAGPAEAQVNGVLRQVGSQQVLNLWGTNYEMGYAHGFLMADKIRDLVANYMVGLLAGGSLTVYNSLLAKDANPAIFQWQQESLDEMNGMAAGMAASGKSLYVASLQRNIDVRDIRALNLQEEFFFGCSSFGVWGNATANGETILARNFDFFYDTQGNIANYQIILAYQPTGKAPFVSFGWPGMYGLFSGLNANSVSVLDNTGNFSNPSSGPYHPVLEMFRDVLENTTGANYLSQPQFILSSESELTPEIIQIGVPYLGSGTPVYYIEESPPSTDLIRYPADTDPGYDHIIATNHFFDAAPPLTSGQSVDRYNTIRNGLLSLYATGNGKVNSAQAWVLLNQVANIVAPTLTSMVIRPNRMEFDLSFGKVTNGSFTAATALQPQTYTWASLFPNIVSVNDAYSTSAATPLNQAAPGVLGNDTSLQGAALSAQTVSGPAHGTLTLNADGSFLYTPAASFTGSDSFSYQASDGTNRGNVATVSVTVIPAISLSTLSLAPASIAGGATSQGTVTLSGAAPAGGVLVSLSDNSPATGLPSGVTVPSGSSSASFTITSTPVTGSTQVTVSAAYGGVLKNATLTLTPPPLSSISGTVSPAPSGAGATLTLNQGSTRVATVSAAANGSFSFPSVANGSYTITPTKPGFSFTPASASLNVNGANVTGINFTAAGLAIDANTFTDRSSIAKTIATPAFSTLAGNELLLAFVSSDANGSKPNITITGVSGGGLTWTLVRRSNAQLGTAEIWRAFASTKLSNATVTASLSQSIAASINVISFAGVNAANPVGAVGGASAASGAPSASLTTQGANSWVFGVGVDWDRGVARTPVSNQSIVHQYLVNNSGIVDTLWVQRQNATVQPAGTVVTIGDSAPVNDRWNLSIVEIRQ